MSLQIADAIGDGARRAFTYSGGVLTLLMFGYQSLFTGATNTITASFLPAAARGAADPRLTLPISVDAAGALAVTGLVAGTVLCVVSARALTQPQSDFGALRSELFNPPGRSGDAVGPRRRSPRRGRGRRRVRLPRGAGRVPGAQLPVRRLRGRRRGRTGLDAMRRSWALAGGDRWPLLAVLVVVTVVTSVGSGLGGALSTVSPAAGQVASIALSSVLTVVGYGILADAYLQLGEEKPSGPDPDRAAGAGAGEGDPLA